MHTPSAPALPRTSIPLHRSAGAAKDETLDAVATPWDDFGGIHNKHAAHKEVGETPPYLAVAATFFFRCRGGVACIGPSLGERVHLSDDDEMGRIEGSARRRRLCGERRIWGISVVCACTPHSQCWMGKVGKGRGRRDWEIGIFCRFWMNGGEDGNCCAIYLSVSFFFVVVRHGIAGFVYVGYGE